MIVLHVAITNKIATYQKRDGDIVCGNKYDEEKQSGYQIKFTFDDEWNAYENKTARFIFGGQFHDVEFTGDTCPVPVLKGVTLCKVGVYAGDLCTTTSATIGCKTSILCKSATPSVENDKYYANEARKYAEEAKQYAENAGNGAGGGAPGENGATFTPSVSDGGVLSWTNDKGLENPDPVNIKGGDGKTPYIKNGNWWIGDIDTGIKAEGKDGKDGLNGIDGMNGKDGRNGTSVTITSIGDIMDETTEEIIGHIVNFSDGKSLTVYNGTNGKDGKDGADGTNGKDGISATHSWNGTTLTITSASGTSSANLKGDKGDKGEQGIQGEKGADGTTQLVPLFANSIEECTDTSKLYVLPDGYIYAYMSTVGALFTNQILNGVDKDGNEFNPDNKGLEFGYISSNGSTQTSPENTSQFYSGFIPYNKENIIKISGVTPNANMAATGVTNQGRIFFYAADKTTDVMSNFFNGFVSEGSATYEPTGYNGTGVVTFDLAKYTQLHGWYGGEIASKAKYIRVGWYAGGDADNAYVTFNEDIEFGTTYQWASTGHAFVPADYESRIIDLEETAENHENRIKAIETYGTGSISGEEIPAYIKAEAENVIDRLIEVKEDAGRCFTIVGLSDFHYYNYDYNHNSPDNDNRRTLINASKAIGYINNRMHIDAVATLGDIVPFGATDDSAIRYTRKYFKEINEILTMTQQSGVIDFRAVGNHDRAGGNDANGNPTPHIPDNTIYSYIGGYNRQCDYVNAPAGYGYKDFDGYKLRVIVLNTAECEGKGRFSEPHHGYFIGNAQYNWLINKALDMSGKENASEWQILILSHHRADDAQVATDGNSWSKNAFILPNILHAYKIGGSYSGAIAEEGISVQCNFTGKNQAKLIGQIHGHHHNYKYQQLYLGASDNSTQTNIMAIGTPTTSFITNGNDDNEGNTYSSVRDTAEDTAFCVYNIDLDNNKIHAIHYGNGIDREINY